MKARTRKVLLLLLTVCVVLPFIAYWLADAWLESSGGRQALERALGERIGMDVKLEGGFKLMLLPDIGVSGDGLRIGDAGPDAEFVSSREYEISVALKPLFDGQVRIEWIRVTGGRVYPGRYVPSGIESAGRAGAGPGLPEIRELEIRDFQIILPGAEQTELQVKSLSVTGFAANRQTPFRFEIDRLLVAQGRLTWDTGREQIRFDEAQLDLSGQAVNAEGCLFLRSPPALHIKLDAAVLDLDALRQTLPAMGPGAEGEDLPVEIRARLVAEELHSGGVVARGAVLSLGEEPGCR